MYELVENLRLTSANLADVHARRCRPARASSRACSTTRRTAIRRSTEFTLLVKQLNETVAKINSGEGTAGKLITDPSVYESINDILIGINESKLLRWLIRNRQQAGIEKRVEEAAEGAGASTPAAAARGRAAAADRRAPTRQEP